MASDQQRRTVSDMDPPSVDTLIADLDETLKNDALREKSRRLQGVGSGRISSISRSPRPQTEPQHALGNPSQDLGLGEEDTPRQPLPAATLPLQSASAQRQPHRQRPSELHGTDISSSTESYDENNETSIMVNVIGKPSPNSSSRAASVIRYPVSNPPSPAPDEQSEIAYLKEKLESFTLAVLVRQEKDKEELDAVKTKLEAVLVREGKAKEELETIKEKLQMTREDLHAQIQTKDDQLLKVQRQLNRNYSDHRRDHRELGFDLASAIQKKDVSLAQVYEHINQFRADHALLQGKVNEQSEEIKKNAEEIALHAKEDWQDVDGN